MRLQDKHVVITGAAGGIGRALAHRFSAEGARAVVVADYDESSTRLTAAELGGLAVHADVSREEEVQRLIATATDAYGPIDVFVSNAGVGGAAGGPEVADAEWDRLWRIHVMAHVWAARVLLPQMIARGEGYLVNTASAAGLLTQPSGLVYTTTKHAAVALAEWLSITYHDRGVRSSCVCPQAVRTRLLAEALSHGEGAARAVNAGGILDPDDVAEAVVKGMLDERVLILPHEDVADRWTLKAAHHEEWMAQLREVVK